MKNFKRLFAIVLSVALLLCSVPMVANAAFADTALNTRSDFDWGVQFHTPNWGSSYSTNKIEEQVKTAYEAGVSLIRVDATAPDGHLEKLASECALYGIKIMVIGYPAGLSGENACADATAISTYFTNLVNKFNGNLAYIQIGNEMDNVAIAASNLNNPAATKESEFNATVLDNISSYVTPAIEGIKAANVVPQIVINFSYTHYGFLDGMASRGIEWDVTGHSWYSEMVNNKYADYATIANEILAKYNKPIILTEMGQRPTEALVAAEETDADATGYNTLVGIASQAYAVPQVIGATFYEFADEPELETGDAFASEAHYGLVKYEDGVMVKKPIYNRIKALLTGGVERVPVDHPTVAPSMQNENRVIQANAGLWGSVTVPAGANMYTTRVGDAYPYRMAGNFKTPMDKISQADFIEFDMYVSEAGVSPTFWITNNQDSAAVRGKVSPTGLVKGWNHVCIPASSIGGNGGFSAATYDKWSSTFFDGGVSSDKDVTVSLANIAITSGAPQVSNTYNTVDVENGISFEKTVAAGTALYPSSYFRLSDSLTTAGADHIEMDVYVSRVPESNIRFWVSNNRESASPGRGAYDIKASELQVGWNHVVLKASQTATTSGTYSFSGYNFVYPFLEGTPFTGAEGGTIKLANISTTSEAPIMNNTYTLIGVGKAGLANSTTVPAASTNMYSANQMWTSLNAVDMTKAEYIEMDIYASVATENRISIWSAADNASVRGSFYVPVLEAGWNHVVIDLSKDLKAANGGFTVAAWETWSGMFWEGDPHSTADVTIKVANIAVTKSTPDMDNNYGGIVYSQEGKFISRTYNVGANTMKFGSWGTVFYYQFKNKSGSVDPIDVSAAEYLEFDMYASAAMPAQNLIVTSGSGDGAGRKGVALPALNEGWNHICIPMNTIGSGSGNSGVESYNTAALNAMYVYNTNVQPVNSDVTSVSFAMANLAFTKENRTYYTITWANEDGTVLDTDEVAEGATPAYTGATPVKASDDEYAYRFAGWTPEIAPATAAATYTAVFNAVELGEFDKVPTAVYTYNTVVEANVDLYGTKTNTNDERFFTQTEYMGSEATLASNGIGFSDMIANPIDMTTGEYFEFDFYSEAAGNVTISVGSQNLSDTQWNGQSFYDCRSQGQSFAVEAGWNHIALSTVGAFARADQSSDPSKAGYDKTRITGFIFRAIPEADTNKIRITNVALTKESPIADYTYSVIDYSEGIIATKDWAEGVTDIYKVTENRLMFNLPKTFDLTRAQFVELDVYISSPMQNLTVWLCNNQDSGARRSYTFRSSGLVAGQWNHLVIDLVSDYGRSEGAFDYTRFNSMFFEGQPSPTQAAVTIKLANIGITKEYPDMDNTYNLVGIAKEGILNSTTVPAGAAMYPTYKMAASLNTVQMADAEYIEMDIYASAATENTIYFWTAPDTAAVRGKFKIPTLNAGWNHVIVDINGGGYGRGEGGFSAANWTEWAYTFFEGVPNSAQDVTLKVANVAVTKFAPDADYTYTPVTEHSEIAGRGVFTDGGKLRWDAEGKVGNWAWYNGKTSFASAVDFTKGDTFEFDMYLGSKADNNISIRFGNAALAWTGARASATINTSDMEIGWNHVVISMSELTIDSGCDMTAINGFFFDGTLLADTEAAIEVGFANFAITADEAPKKEMVYTGKVNSVYSDIAVYIAKGVDLSTAIAPYQLPIALDLADITHIEFNLYVGAKCDVKFRLSSMPTDEYDPDYGMDAFYDATYTITGLTFGWNQVSIPVSELVEGAWFDSTAVTYYYFSGVIADTLDAEFAVEDFALTSTAQEFDIAKGDYNADNEVDMLDLISAKNASLADEQTWFGNAAELDGAVNGVIDATDVIAIRKLLWSMF